MNARYRCLLVTLPCALLPACMGQPTPQKIPEQVTLPCPSGPEAAALWLAMSNDSDGGALARLDLATGKLSPHVLETGADVQIDPDASGTDTGLVLLTRRIEDSVTILRGSGAHVAAEQKLDDEVNPQHAARDSQGRLWVTSYDSNQVRVFSADLRQTVATIDLSSLSESPNQPCSTRQPQGCAELAQVTMLDAHHMAVSADRLVRSSVRWQPKPQSGLAVISTDTFAVESTELPVVPNPVTLAVRANSLYMIGSGDLSDLAGAPGSANSAWASWPIGSFTSNAEGPAPNDLQPFDDPVLDADFPAAGASPAVVVWHPKRNQSCVEVGGTELACAGSSEGGYVFNRLAWIGGAIYVSYVEPMAPALWIIPGPGPGPGPTTAECGGSSTITKIAMPMPIESLSRGP